MFSKDVENNIYKFNIYKIFISLLLMFEILLLLSLFRWVKIEKFINM